MEDDTEVLDWGHEEELAVAVHASEKRSFDIDDAEDAVSLGGDEEDEFLTYQSRVPQDTPQPQKNIRQPRQDPPEARSESPHTLQQEEERTGSGDQSLLSARTLVHALPPKPVVSTVPFVHPSHPSIIEATAMASRAERDKRNGAASVYDYTDSLPPGWEVKYPRNGRGVYYYNIHTQESTWTRPAAPSPREKRGERSDRRDDPLDKSLSTRNGDSLIPRVGRTEGGDMSYDDRHYRPGESGRREERPVRSSQRIDSYVPDSYSPRNSRPSPSPRARERDLTPPSRRPSSPIDAYGDRDGSYREAPSAAVSSQDRVRDNVPRERTRERRQRDDPPPSESDRRNLPRDSERSSTLSTLSASSPTPHLSYSARVLLPRWRTKHLADVSRSLGSRAAPYNILFIFVRLPRMDTRTLIIDHYLPPFAICLFFAPPFTSLLASLFFRAKVSRLLYSWLSGISKYHPALIDQAISAGFGSAPR